jgi:hypothetical protein
LKAADFINSSPLFVEFARDLVRALDGANGFETPIERAADGRITDGSRHTLINALSAFLKRNAFSSRRPALCAIAARGVSLRQLLLPKCSQDDFQRLLLLQIESEFPLAPDQMAWGCEVLAASDETKQRVLVVAVKRETVEDYSSILAQCGLTCGFTVAAMARNFLLTAPPASYSMLDVAPNYSELLTFQQGTANSLRVLPVGSANTDAELKSILPGACTGTRVYLSGQNVQTRLADAIDSKLTVEHLDASEGLGRSAAILGLKRYCEDNAGRPPLLLETAKIVAIESAAKPLRLRWLATAAVLALCALSLRYAEAVIRKPQLERQLSELKAHRAKLPNIDRELSFLQFLQTNQPPYLDRLYVIANAAPQGTRVESLGMSRRGDLSLRVAMQNSQQLTDFRTKLIDSGFLSSVVVEEQAPSPDRQKLSARLNAVWKPTADRKALEAAQPVVKGPERRQGADLANNPKVLTVNSNQPAPKVQISGVHLNTMSASPTNSNQTAPGESRK